MSTNKYYKIFNAEENHNGFQYQDGLNVDTIPFNSNPRDSCCEGGFYFTTIEHIFKFLDYGCYLREVEVPKDVTIIKDPDGDKYRAHSLFLHERRNLDDIVTWKYLVEHGANIHADEDLALRRASKNGHLEVVKYLVEQGADIHAFNDYALRDASLNGHLEVVKYLVEQGANINAREDYALCYASANGHLEVVKYLVERGANINAENDYALRDASLNGHLEVVKYLEEQANK